MGIEMDCELGEIKHNLHLISKSKKNINLGVGSVSLKLKYRTTHFD